jgi:hypothetical protein
MKALVLTAALALAGCATGHYEVDSKAMDHTKMAFVGLPTVLGGFTGTTTPINETRSLTAKHVAYVTLRRIEKTDAFCDLALIKQNNSGEVFPTMITSTHRGMKVRLFGYSGITGLPVSSEGTVGGYSMHDGCNLAWVGDAGGVAGMSGGAVMREDGALVGIVVGGDVFKGRVYFVPGQNIRKFLGMDRH